jgi:hypothetical protein
MRIKVSDLSDYSVSGCQRTFVARWSLAKSAAASATAHANMPPVSTNRNSAACREDALPAMPALCEHRHKCERA